MFEDIRKNKIKSWLIVFAFLVVITLIILAKVKLQTFANGKVKKTYRVLSCISIIIFVICFAMRYHRVV